jgi:AmmeMemoRadiSam system protein A
VDLRGREGVVKDSVLSQSDRAELLKLARHALEAAVNGRKMPPLDLAQYPPEFSEPGATFVTLTTSGQLRGCIGALEAYQPLAEDVCEHAIAAAQQDYRFPPLTPGELPNIEIEISRLTQPFPLDYSTPKDLVNKLRPGIDGVILKDGYRRATFLPQVWGKIPGPAEFLNNLCYKMGANPDLWQHKHLEVFTYQVEEFHE